LGAQSPPNPPFAGSSISGLPLEDEAEIGRWKYGTPKPELPADMDMNRYFPLTIALGEPPIIYGAADVLDQLADTVGIVLELFRPCIEVGAAPLPLSSTLARFLSGRTT
jgi:hypothetical protein